MPSNLRIHSPQKTNKTEFKSFLGGEVSITTKKKNTRFRWGFFNPANPTRTHFLVRPTPTSCRTESCSALGTLEAVDLAKKSSMTRPCMREVPSNGVSAMTRSCGARSPKDDKSPSWLWHANSTPPHHHTTTPPHHHTTTPPHQSIPPKKPHLDVPG